MNICLFLGLFGGAVTAVYIVSDEKLDGDCESWVGNGMGRTMFDLF
jgi:hypothetical protein